eukprot:TRINITY_DN9449_c0_g1_i23.p1 TRINITY_DN9449_c0_g1~~TRINITY_DN9449_c0_g1_i23.p1  ORF type:complete len:258 (+),score=57.56 TRINITY_DN9449_c0_g1_i23:41-814(+)
MYLLLSYINRHKSCLVMERYYVRDAIPGYTGHIPKKINSFAMTAGAINDQLLVKKDDQVPMQRTYFTKSIPHVMSDGDKTKYGYRSRYAISWIAGPTQKVFPQHIPLYQGFVPSIGTENIMARSFGRCTKTAIVGHHPKGFDLPAENKYLSTYRKKFSEKKNRRLIAEPEMAREGKDQRDFEDLGGNVPPIKPTLVYLSTVSPKTSLKEYRSSQFDFSSTRPRWTSRDVKHEAEYMTLSDGFKKVFDDAKVTLRYRA